MDCFVLFMRKVAFEYIPFFFFLISKKIILKNHKRTKTTQRIQRGEQKEKKRKEKRKNKNTRKTTKTKYKEEN